MPVFYNYTENGVAYSFDDVFVPADAFREGNLWIWGLHNYSSDGGAGNRATPVTARVGGYNWKQVSSGGYTTSAIKTDGTLWGWGRNSSGQLGRGITSNSIDAVTTFAGGTNWKQVSSGGYHTSAIKTDGTLWTWGSNSSGELGIADASNRNTPITTLAGGTNWKQVSCGNNYTSAIKTDGTLWTWGNNSFGQLGRGEDFSRTPVTTIAGGTNWAYISSGYAGDADEPKPIACGYNHTSAIKTDGTLWTWGYNNNGELGNNAINQIHTPVTTFAGGIDWRSVSAGQYHTAAIKTDGTLWNWGLNNAGYPNTNTLGTNTDGANKVTPVTTFAGGTNWKQVSCGRLHTAAVKQDGTLWTWGSGTGLYSTFTGALGVGDLSGRNTPVTTFAGGTDWKQVSCGYSHTAAVKTDGTLWSWGYNYGDWFLPEKGTLGTNDVINRCTPVTTFAGGTNWKQVSCGKYHTAAIKTDGTLWTWGYNGNGQLGDNTTRVRSIPVTTFVGGNNWKQVAGGSQHTAAIKTDGTLWTWGYNALGQLGDNTAITRSNPVTTFAGGTNWKQVVCGDNHTAAVLDDGTNKILYTFGYNFWGQLGTLDYSFPNPRTVFGSTNNWKQVSCGYRHTGAIKTDGTLWTWGSNSFGPLGTNGGGTKYTPVTTFAGGTNWKQVDGGDNYTAAIKTDGTLWTWGYNSNGQLGRGDGSQFFPVTTFAGGTNWKQVFCGYRHTGAIKTDGTLWTWGYNLFNQLGINDISGTSRYTPVTTFAGGTNWKQVSTLKYGFTGLTYIDSYQ
jgi:alpha-tubulin suppressor-like RCC1 family protein